MTAPVHRRSFDTGSLIPERGVYGPHPLGGFFIRVPLAPFRFRDELVSTSVRLDRVMLQNAVPDSLEAKTFSFPVNPAAGFIDGSIYIDGAHHPVDVTEIAFGHMRKSGGTATFKCIIDFTFEGLGDFGKTPWTFDAALDWTSEAQTA
jgi:hypothetical protein